ncbi:hypothetical protein [Caballeronia grimmiae]|uniref:hypothetical protein n=1 Tax=Caballeronia grimmiae TaxID=1071679 RepID=UPI0038BB62B1
MDSKLIVVAPDNVVREARNAEAERKGFDFRDAAEKSLKFFFSPYITAATTVAEALQSLYKARESGLNVVQISRSEAARFVFPPGHPRDNTLYGAHPAKKGVYFAVSSFHRLAFEHKFSEAVELLMALGASEIRVEHICGWSREFAAKLSAPLPEAAVSAEVSSKESTSSSLLYKANLPGSTSPRLPEEMVWYQHEPTWQSIAKGRLDYGLKEFSLTVNYDDDFGINAGLKATASKAEFELGGSFEDHRATSWKLHGKFLSDSNNAA